MKTLSNFLMVLFVISSVVYSVEAQVKFSDKVGGNNGEHFMIPSTRSTVLSSQGIKGIAIQHGRRIESILVEYADRDKVIQTESIGNDSGQWSYIDLEEGEFITYISGKAGTLIDQLTFHTSLRRTFGPYGGNGGQYFEITVPSNALIIGFTGIDGPSIKQIGLIYRLMNKGSRLSKNQERGTHYQRKGDSSPIINNKRKVRDHRYKKTNSIGMTYADSMKTLTFPNHLNAKADTHRLKRMAGGIEKELAKN